MCKWLVTEVMRKIGQKFIATYTLKYGIVYYYECNCAMLQNNALERAWTFANRWISFLPYILSHLLIQPLFSLQVSFLKRSLKNTTSMIGDSVSRAFLKALVMLIGGYREALNFSSREKITFDKDAFIRTRPTNMQPFLSKMLHLQIFHQFIEDRLQMLNQGEGFCDEFEFELNMYEDKGANKLKSQYDKWSSAMKKEGGAILKSVNPLVRSAYKQAKQGGRKVKDRSKRAYKDLRSKFHDPVRSDGSKSSGSPQSSPKERSRRRIQTLVLNDHSMGKGGINASRKLSNGSTISSPFSKDNGDSKMIAPEASSEDSEIDSERGSQTMVTFRYDPINTDMGDLNDIIAGYGVKCTIQDTSPTTMTAATSPVSSSNTTTVTSATVGSVAPSLSLVGSRAVIDNCKSSSNGSIGYGNGNSATGTGLVATPLVPPRKVRTLRGDSKTDNNNLISLGSSPEDEASIIFDPLMESDSSGSKRGMSGTGNGLIRSPPGVSNGNVGGGGNLRRQSSRILHPTLPPPPPPPVMANTGAATVGTTSGVSTFTLPVKPRIPPVPGSRLSTTSLPSSMPSSMPTATNTATGTIITPSGMPLYFTNALAQLNDYSQDVSGTGGHCAQDFYSPSRPRYPPNTLYYSSNNNSATITSPNAPSGAPSVATAARVYGGDHRALNGRPCSLNNGNTSAAMYLQQQKSLNFVQHSGSDSCTLNNGYPSGGSGVSAGFNNNSNNQTNTLGPNVSGNANMSMAAAALMGIRNSPSNPYKQAWTQFE